MNEVIQLVKKELKPKRIWAIFIAVCLIGIWDFLYFLTAPIQIQPHSQVEVQNQEDRVILKRGENVFDLAEKLSEKKFITSPWHLVVYAVLTGQYKQLKAGEYELKPYTNIRAFVDDVANGKSLIRQFTLIEGEDFSNLKDKTAQLPIKYDEKTDIWVKNLINKMNIAEVEGQVNLNSYFLADSYAYIYDDSFVVVLQAAFEKMNETLKQFRDQYQSSWSETMSDQEMVIVASLLEKESSDYEDQRMIAGVIKNRLAQSMRLQIDASVIFAIKNQQTVHSTAGTVLSLQDLKTPSPYNTYLQKGLPPSAIAIVGESALKAAFNPIAHSYLFYVANESGLHDFSQTYDQHLKLIQIQKSKNQPNPNNKQ